LSPGRILAVAANTFREAVRQRVLYNLVLFSVLMTLSGLLLGELSIRQDEKILKDVGLASMDLFGSLMALFLGVSLVNREIERRTLDPLLAKPLLRDELMLGKFFGLSFTLALNLAVMAVGLYATLLATGGRLDPHLLKAVYGIFLGLLVTVAVALAFSTLSSPALAGICTVAAWLGGRFSDVIRNMQEVAPAAPGWLVHLLYHATPDLQRLDFKDQVVYGDPVTAGTLAGATLYVFLYVGVVLGLALLAFRRKELQ
jgi:Cu-processing system permease protein